MSEKHTIVLLEDDRVLRDLMTDGLRDSGHSVVPVTDAEQLARELVKLGGQVILVADRDLGSESANGFTLAEAALQEYPALKVIYVSGTQLAVKRRLSSERERSLLKPFAIAQLEGLVKQLS